jgi:hypothetical protein
MRNRGTTLNVESAENSKNLLATFFAVFAVSAFKYVGAGFSRPGELRAES